MNYPDYFKTTEHEERVKGAIAREQARLLQITEVSGPLAAVSDAIGAMSAHISFFRSLGLKQVAISLLKDALSIARKGVSQ